MSYKPRFRDATAIVATAILIGTLSGCEEQLAPGEPGFVAATPVGNKVDDPATLQNIPIETIVEVSGGYAFRILVNGDEVAAQVNPIAGTGATTLQHIQPGMVGGERLAVEVLTVEGWQPTTLGPTYAYTSGSAYTNPDGSYRPYFGMQVLDDGRIVHNTENYETVDEIPRADIDKLQCGLTATPSLPSRLCSIFVDHRTQEEATLSLGAWQIKLPADYHGLLTPPVLQPTQSIEVSLDGQHLGTITLDPFDPELSFVNPQWLIDTTSRRHYAAHREHYSDMPVFDYGDGTTSGPDSQYMSFSGQTIYSLPYTIDHFLQAAPDSVMVETYGGAFGGSTSRGVLEEVSVGYIELYPPPQP